MSRYKVLVVDDSVFMRKLITDIIAEESIFEVIATAKNGIEAVDKVKELRPDIVTMDIEMPEMNGLEALRRIMQDQPTPVLMLSSLTEEGAKETVQALEWGAVDFVRKPSGSISLDLYKIKAMLIEKLKMAIMSKVQRIPASKPIIPKLDIKAKQTMDLMLTGKSAQIDQMVAIGTSTGGPRALHQVLSLIPENFPAPIVIVQHMPPNFTKSLAQRLDLVSKVRVVEAEEGMVLHNATAYIAPGGWHMKVIKESTAYKINLTKDPIRAGHRPSVDTLFESLIPFHEIKRHIVIMTGMGSDGAQAMLALHKAGAATTIAESEETCVVYGMPRAAVELQCVSHIVPLHLITNRLVQAVLA